MNKVCVNQDELKKKQIQEQYDAIVKKFLSGRYVLAWILKECTAEFKSFSIEQIAKEAFVGNISVSTKVVDQDEKDLPEDLPPQIDTSNTEDKSKNEGTIYYDIRFTAKVPDTDKEVYLIINVEAQKDSASYPFEKRGIYYCSRMISSQKNTVFMKDDYKSIRKVYSIWILMNIKKERQNTINLYKITEQRIIGDYQASPENYELLNMVMIGLGNVEDTEPETILNMLDVMLKSKKTAKEKQEILSNVYRIPSSEITKEDIDKMYNLGQATYDWGYDSGYDSGGLGMLKKLVDNGVLSLQTAAAQVNMSEEAFIQKTSNTK